MKLLAVLVLLVSYTAANPVDSDKVLLGGHDAIPLLTKEFIEKAVALIKERLPKEDFDRVVDIFNDIKEACKELWEIDDDKEKMIKVIKTLIEIDFALFHLRDLKQKYFPEVNLKGFLDEDEH